MNIIGIIVGIAIVAGLIIAMGKMSEHGVEINDNFRCGDCLSCGDQDPANPVTCIHFKELSELHLDPDVIRGGRD